MANNKVGDFTRVLTYVVVHVHAGIPVGAEIYHDRRSAEERERFIRKHMHPEHDETGTFEVEIGYPSPSMEQSLWYSD